MNDFWSNSKRRDEKLWCGTFLLLFFFSINGSSAISKFERAFVIPILLCLCMYCMYCKYYVTVKEYYCTLVF